MYSILESINNYLDPPVDSLMHEPILIPPSGGSVQRRSGICLNMIVKNETPVLERLFRSVKDVIDYFVIVDTGSTDGTPQHIQELARSFALPGEIHSRPWVNFGHNRQEALELAVAAGQADWLLFIDADEELACSDPAWFSKLEPGTSYQLEKHQDTLRYALNNLIWIDGTDWRWHGVLHEYVLSPHEHPLQRVLDAWIIYHLGEGVRSRGITFREKFLRDAAILEAELRSHPQDARSRFYLAQSYHDAGEPAKAHKHYGLRAEMGGWEEEVFVAQYRKARLAIELEHSHATIVEQLLKAYSLRPSRAEPLWQLARHCRRNEHYAEGYVFAKVGKDIPEPSADILFINRDVYAWQLLDEFAVCAFWIGQYREAIEACERLLDEAALPGDEQPRIQANLEHARRELGLPAPA